MSNNTYKYKEDEKVKKNFEEYSNFKETERPKDYSFSDSALLDKTKNDYFNSSSFSYNLNSDPLYQQYKDSYLKEGKRAMEDTVGNASSLTGGYANSYAVSAGNAAYNDYVGKLNDVIPELYSLAYSEHKDRLDLLGDKLKYLSDKDKDEYSRYQDSYKSYADELERLRDFYLNSSELDRDTQKNEWESAYKDAVLNQDKYEFNAEMNLKNQELVQNQQKINQTQDQIDQKHFELFLKEEQNKLEREKFEESKREYFREDELYVMLGNGGYYNVLLALDVNYNNDQAIKLKALTMGIPEDYIDSYIDAKHGR